MTTLFDKLIDFEILGGFDYSEEEKKKLLQDAYDLGFDPGDFKSWEDLKSAVDDELEEEEQD